MMRLILSVHRGRSVSQYLAFQLHGLTASWDVDAFGETRYNHELSPRSALPGLLTVALGIHCEEEQRLSALS